LIRRICHAGCAHCCAYLPIARFDCFSLSSVCLPVSNPSLYAIAPIVDAGNRQRALTAARAPPAATPPHSRDQR
jgi:hypothetical protein